MATSERPKPLLKMILRQLVPDRLLTERAIYLRLGPRAGRIYLKLLTMDRLGIGASNRRKVPGGARSFLFVCYGNIMRSPMGELLLRRAVAERGVQEITISSAGIHAIPGTAAHPRAQVAARELGLPLDDHRSQLLTARMTEQADAIFAMDFQNKAELLAMFPEAKNKIFMLGAYGGGETTTCQISDPFFGDQEEARNCYRVLQACIDNLAESLWPTRRPQSDSAERSALASTRV